MSDHPIGVEAFDALVRAHYGRLCDFVYRYVRSREVAEDIVQDIFVRLLKSGTFDFDDPLAYLYRAARNGAASHLRRERVRERFLAEAGAAPTAPPADVDVQYHELADAIAHAVDSLPQRARQIFTMHREQGLSYGEIARALDLSPKTVENQMGRALKALRARLAPFLSIGFVALSVVRITERLFH